MWRFLSKHPAIHRHGVAGDKRGLDWSEQSQRLRRPLRRDGPCVSWPDYSQIPIQNYSSRSKQHSRSGLRLLFGLLIPNLYDFSCNYLTINHLVKSGIAVMNH
jgi:hypothetical protein